MADNHAKVAAYNEAAHGGVPMPMPMSTSAPSLIRDRLGLRVTVTKSAVLMPPPGMVVEFIVAVSNGASQHSGQRERGSMALVERYGEIVVWATANSRDWLSPSLQNLAFYTHPWLVDELIAMGRELWPQIKGAERR